MTFVCPILLQIVLTPTTVLTLHVLLKPVILVMILNSERMLSVLQTTTIHARVRYFTERTLIVMQKVLIRARIPCFLEKEVVATGYILVHVQILYLAVKEVIVPELVKILHFPERVVSAGEVIVLDLPLKQGLSV